MFTVSHNVYSKSVPGSVLFVSIGVVIFLIGAILLYFSRVPLIEVVNDVILYRTPFSSHREVIHCSEIRSIEGEKSSSGRGYIEFVVIKTVTSRITINVTHCAGRVDDIVRDLRSYIS
jgi:hypothetical protein